MMIMSSMLYAYDIEIDGIYYNLNKEDKNAEVTNGDKRYSGSVSIPESFIYLSEKYTVTSVGTEAFYGNRDLVSVNLPNTITNIGEKAFAWCSLKSIIIPNSVINIGKRSFYLCTYLNSISIPNSLNSIGDYAFCGCSGLMSVNIPNSITSIEPYTFDGCSSLTSIDIPNSVTSIEQGAFSGCYNLTSVKIPNSVTNIGIGSFADCTKLTSIVIPNSVTNIGGSTFQGCTDLTSVLISNSVTDIGSSTFTGCTNLLSITIPNSITSLGFGLFQGCTNLTSVEIPNSVTKIGDYTFADCKNLSSIIIPNSVTSIGFKAFANCSSLDSVTMPNSLTKIGGYAFNGCERLNTITLSINIKSISSSAFAGCKSIETVTSYAVKVPSTMSDAFQDSNINCATLIVHAEALDAYKTTIPWSEFGAFKILDGNEILPEPETKKCSAPNITYANGKLFFETDTEGAEVISEINVDDAKKSNTLEVPLSATYNITAYATKNGYDNSEVVTATLVWVDAQLTTDTLSDMQAVKARPILVSSNDGNVTIKGLEDNENVDVYSLSGAKLNSIKSTFGTASFKEDKGNVVIVKVGDKSIKVAVK